MNSVNWKTWEIGEECYVAHGGYHHGKVEKIGRKYVTVRAGSRTYEFDMTKPHFPVKGAYYGCQPWLQSMEQATLNKAREQAETAVQKLADHIKKCRKATRLAGIVGVINDWLKHFEDEDAQVQNPPG